MSLNDTLLRWKTDTADPKQDFFEYILPTNFKHPGKILTKPDSNQCEPHPELGRGGESGLYMGVLVETRLLSSVLGGLVPVLGLPWDCVSFSQKLKCFKQSSFSWHSRLTNSARILLHLIVTPIWNKLTQLGTHSLFVVLTNYEALLHLLTVYWCFKVEVMRSLYTTKGIYKNCRAQTHHLLTGTIQVILQIICQSVAATL